MSRAFDWFVVTLFARPLRLAIILAAVVALAVTLTAVAGVAVADERAGGCNTHRCVERVKARIHAEHERRVWQGVPRAVRAHLRRIARCESGGNPRAVSPGGTYRGKYQFSYSTWASVGGKGDPATASEVEQDRRAIRLYRTGGPGHWPVCQWR